MDLVTPATRPAPARAAPAWVPLVTGDYGAHRFAVALAADKRHLRISFAEPGDADDPDGWAHAQFALERMLDKSYSAFLATLDPDHE